MKAFGFLSFGHYAREGRRGLSGRDALHQAIELSVAANDLGVNGVYFRVHHFAPWVLHLCLCFPRLLPVRSILRSVPA